MFILRKKEDDMHNRPAERVIRPVSDAKEGTSISRKDEKNPPHDKFLAKKPSPSDSEADDEVFEPYLGVLIDYTA